MNNEKTYVSPEGLAYAYTKLKNEIPIAVEAEKGNIVDLLIQELQGLPVFGTVDADNTIKVTSQLSAGTYTLKYENTDGIYANIGTITIESNSGGGDVAYTNLIDLTPTTDTVITTASEGWIDGYRISDSEKIAKPADGFYMTNIIPVGSGAKVLRIKNFDLTKGYSRIYFYNDTTYEWQFGPSSAIEWTSLTPEYTEVNMSEIEKIRQDWYASTFNSIRLCGMLTGTKEDVIVTLDEEII